MPAADTFVKDNDDFHLKDYEMNPDPLVAADLSWEEAIFGGHPKVDNDHAINADLDGKGGGLLGKENELYTDKTVTECEMPEFVVCYNENQEKVGVTYACEEGSEANNIPSVQVLDPKHLIQPANTSDDGEIKVVPFQNQSEEVVASPQSPDLSTADESSSSSNTEALTYDSKIETGSITFDFNSLNPLAPPGMAQEQKTEHAVEKAPQTQMITRDQGEPSFGAASVASFDGRVHGETSFSANAPPSSITYSGPVAYSRSVSLRSESSAGSTHSFAFPVLQIEWNNSPVRMPKADYSNNFFTCRLQTEGNSSPVRMAKADQRHFMKRKGWVESLLESLLCIKF